MKNKLVLVLLFCMSNSCFGMEKSNSSENLNPENLKKELARLQQENVQLKLQHEISKVRKENSLLMSNMQPNQVVLPQPQAQVRQPNRCCRYVENCIPLPIQCCVWVCYVCICRGGSEE